MNPAWPRGAEVLCADAGLHFPTGVHFDGISGRLIVCDGQNGRVVSCSVDAATGSDARVLATELRWPYSVCIKEETVLVLEESGHCVRSLPSGMVVCGSPEQKLGSDLASLKRPYAMCKISDGSLLIADKDNNRILRWKPGSRHYLPLLLRSRV